MNFFTTSIGDIRQVKSALGCLGACSNTSESSDATSLAREIEERKRNGPGRYVEEEIIQCTSTSLDTFASSSCVDDFCVNHRQLCEYSTSARGVWLGPQPSLPAAPCTCVPLEAPLQIPSIVDSSDSDGSEQCSLSQNGDFYDHDGRLASDGRTHGNSDGCEFNLVSESDLDVFATTGTLVTISVQNIAGNILWGPAAVASQESVLNFCGRILAKVVEWPARLLTLLNGQQVMQPDEFLECGGLLVDGAVLTLVKRPEHEVIVQYDTSFGKTMADDYLAKPTTVTYTPGLYYVKDVVSICAGPSLCSLGVAELNVGTIVTVVEVVLYDVCMCEPRVRGRIEQPVEGWISLATPGKMGSWVRHIPDTCEN